MTTAAFPYAHPRRPEGPLQAGDRVRFRCDDGVSYASVLSEPVNLGDFNVQGGFVYLAWDDYECNDGEPDLFPVTDLERFGRTPAAFLPKDYDAERLSR